MVKYWAVYSIDDYSSPMKYTKRDGNYDFVTSIEKRATGKYKIGIIYPTGWTQYNVLVWAVGKVAANITGTNNSQLYCTLNYGPSSNNIAYLNANSTSGSSPTDGLFDLFFLCL